MNTHTLIIRHVSSGPDTFEVMRLKDGKRTPKPAEIRAPDLLKVEGRPNSSLSTDLRWYLENFLDYPFHPDTEIAERVRDSLEKWGEDAFNALFDNRDGGAMLEDAAVNGHYKNLHLQIASDDPGVLAWPWEALRDPKAGYLAHACQIERRLDRVPDPAPFPENLPKDRVNILLVTARPFENDVQYRSVSRLLVELVQKRRLPASVRVLRPPTFESLRSHLRENPDFYHILHFDGHGAYGRSTDSASGFTFRGLEGCLVFETDTGEPDPFSAEKISTLLREHAVPVVVLNACQSAMIDKDARNTFASVASSMIRCGTRSVVAMAYSLYVSGAQSFLPDFYQRLFETGSVSVAVRAGRQKMLENPYRVCAKGRHPLDDWLVPVLYQQDPPDLSFALLAKKTSETSEVLETSEVFADRENPYGFIGRDGPVLELERAMRKKTPGILIQGMGGVGKTTLARGFVKWLSDTQGLGSGCFWFPFDEIRNAEYVFNRMGEALFGGNFSLAPVDERISALVSVFRENPYIIVWDNFEVVRGIHGTEIHPVLSDADQALLRGFLKKLRGGLTKVLITSRSEEEWLGTERLKIGVRGLEHEERWLFVEEILGAMGMKINRNDPDMIKLTDLLAGHPLSMRVILPMLEKRKATDLIKALSSDVEIFAKEGDEANARFYATLRVARTALPSDLRELLPLLGMHEKFIHLGLFQRMAQQVGAEWTREPMSRFADALVHMGLIFDRGNDVYELHPALTGYLRSGAAGDMPDDSGNLWARAFVDVMGRLADDLAPKELHEQRGWFHLFGAGFYHAMEIAGQLEMHSYYRAILQALAQYAWNTMSLSEAQNLFEKLVQAHKENGTSEGEAAAYHQLGRIAEEHRDFQTAEKWYRKSLEIEEKHGSEHGAAITYHQLGSIAQEQRDFQTSEKWYRKSLEIKEKHGNEHGAASTYHQLGRIAEEQRDFQTAEKWYRKSLEISEKLGIDHYAAITYHQLGMIAEEQRDFQTAEKWYRKSLEIKEKHGNEHGAASTYGQLGIISKLREDYETSGKWLIRSITGFARTNDPTGVQQAVGNFTIIYKESPPPIQEKLRAMWEQADIGEFPV
ncbi:MAG: tetratricopeptide repeat protein [Desulfobacteraceae bacterium]|nr:tetratricopeptide repeat protein [Desulfobacteraceae bacterium]